MSSKKYTFTVKAAVCIFPFVMTALLYMTAPYVVELMWSLFGVCLFYKYTGFWCPACGNTRSVTALMRGDILTSLSYNITPMVLLILTVCGYAEIVCAVVFNKKVKLLPRSLPFHITLIVLMAVYYLIRNFVPFMLPLK